MKAPQLISGLGLTIITSLFFLTNPEKSVDRTTASIPEPGQSKLEQQTDTLNIVLAQDLKSLRQELAKIKLELGRVTSSLSSQKPVTNTSAWDEANLPSFEEAENPEAIEERNKLASEQRRLALEDDFTNETVNKTWSKEYTSTVLAVLESLPAEIHEGIVFNATECRSTSCRIEIEYGDEIAQQELEMRLPMLIGENFPGISATHVQQDGITTSVYFLNSDKS